MTDARPTHQNAGSEFGNKPDSRFVWVASSQPPLAVFPRLLLKVVGKDFRGRKSVSGGFSVGKLLVWNHLCTLERGQGSEVAFRGRSLKNILFLLTDVECFCQSDSEL